jgi:hypothetical protein
LSGLPPVGRFTPTQIVRGAILTCASTSAAGPLGDTGCQGIKLNGLDIRGATGGTISFAEANAVCNAVAGGNWSTILFAGTIPGPYFIWNGSNWALASTPAQPIQDLYCFSSVSTAASGLSVRRVGSQVKSISRSGKPGRKGH